MRLKRLENQWRVWMNPHDYQTLLANAPHQRGRLAIRFGAEVGLRVSETTNVQVNHVHESTHPEVDCHFIGVFGKDTSGDLGELGKYREAFLPYELYDKMMGLAIKQNAAPNQAIFGVTKRTLQAWVKTAAENAADDTGNDDFAKLSSHDLRAYFASTALIRHDMNVRVVMEVGGWSDFKSMQPYLNAQFDDIIAAEFQQAGIA